MCGARAALEKSGPGSKPRGRRGWLSFAVGGGERGPLAFGETEREVEKRRVDARMERLGAQLDV
jgi:50S ribosomal subunit-associated GTPase HflX